MTILAEASAPAAETVLNGAELATEVSRLAEEVRLLLYEQGVVETPLETFNDFAPEGYELLVKNEGLQRTGAFKVRGATAALHFGMREAEAKGERISRVVTASDGNHGLGVQAAAAAMGLPCVVKMPRTISQERKDRLRATGAEIDDRPTDFEQAKQAATQEAELHPDTLYIEAFDALTTMAGQAGMAFETLEDLLVRHQNGELDLGRDEVVIFVAIAGGGMAAAFASVMQKARRQGVIGKNVRLIGVQQENSDAFSRDFYGKGPLTDEMLDKTCESTAVLEGGKITKAILLDAECFEEVMSVSRSETGAEMLFMQDRYGKTEPAGALSAAGARKFAQISGVPNDGRRHVLVTVRCGSDLVTDEQYNDYINEADDDVRQRFHAVVERQRSLRRLQEQVAEYQESVRRAAGRKALEQTKLQHSNLPPGVCPPPASEIIHPLKVWRSSTYQHNIYDRGLNRPISTRFDRQ